MPLVRVAPKSHRPTLRSSRAAPYKSGLGLDSSRIQMLVFFPSWSPFLSCPFCVRIPPASAFSFVFGYYYIPLTLDRSRARVGHLDLPSVKFSLFFLSPCPSSSSPRGLSQAGSTFASPFSLLPPFPLDSVVITSTYCPRACVNIKGSLFGPGKARQSEAQFLFFFPSADPFDGDLSPCAIVRPTGLAPFRLLRL